MTTYADCRSTSASASTLIVTVVLLVFAAIIGAVGYVATSEVSLQPAGQAVPKIDLDEVTWDVAHGVARHGEDFSKAVERLNACSPQIYFCGNPVDDTWSDTYFVTFCPVHEGARLCAGAFIGRMGQGFTAYIGPCVWWESKAAECQN